MNRIEADLAPRGLPGRLPEGERLLWQGAPDWRVLARTALHVRKIAIYFAAVLAYYAASSLHGGAAPGAVALATLRFAGLALAPVALLSGYAWLICRMTTFSITTRRVVIRSGVVVQTSINLPFARIEAADLKPTGHDTGDIALRLAPGNKLAYFVLWPYARPWRMARPEPSLRALRGVAEVAQILARALAISAQQPVPGATDPSRAVAVQPGGNAAAVA